MEPGEASNAPRACRRGSRVRMAHGGRPDRSRGRACGVGRLRAALARRGRRRSRSLASRSRPSAPAMTLSGCSGATAPTPVSRPEPLSVPAAVPIAGHHQRHGHVLVQGRPRSQHPLPRRLATGHAARPVKLTVSALGRTAITSRAITLGRAGVTVLVYHPRDLRWGGARVQLVVRDGGRHGRFVAAPATRAKRLSPYVVKLDDDGHAARGPVLLARLLARAARRRAAQPPASARVHGRGYHGGGSLPDGYPSPARSAAAAGVPRGADRPDGVRGRRHRGPAVGREPALDVRVRQRRQGDAAGRLPAAAERDGPALRRLVQQLVPVPDDQRLGQHAPRRTHGRSSATAASTRSPTPPG